jgi:hypothetical protein
MASEKAETRLRIANGVLVLVLALGALFMAWLSESDTLLRIVLGVVAILALLLDLSVLRGRTKAGRLVRTTRRWKYAGLVVYLALTAVMVSVTVVSTSGLPAGNAPWGLFPALLALFLVQLYEPEVASRSKAASLSDSNARAYWRIGLLALLGGVVLGSMGILGAIAGSHMLAAQLLPPGVFCLVFAFGIWMMLRSRNQQPGTKQ